MLEWNPAQELVEVLEHLEENVLSEVLLGGSPWQMSPNDSQDQWVQMFNEFAGCLIIAGPNPRQKSG